MESSDPLPATDAIIYVIDDDTSVRKALTRLFKSMGWQVAAFESGLDFLEAEIVSGACCVILDVRMPGMSGLDLQEEIVARKMDLPIVFITAHDDGHTRAKALGAGAVAFLPKPLDNHQLVDIVRQVINRDTPQPQRGNEVAR